MKILTFDIEEWFHILDNNKTRTISDWNKFDSRIRIGMNLIYDILDGTEKSATFFVVRSRMQCCAVLKQPRCPHQK